MIEEWLKNNVPGYSSLGPEEIEAVKNFSLLWSFFEYQVLGTSASPKTIRDKINTWKVTELLKPEEFEKYKDYFVKRYIEDNNTNNKFENHLFRPKEDSKLITCVGSVLKGETDDISEVVTALLIIVYRYRNNFFHGNKWAYKFQGQLNNFEIANELLMKIMEIDNSPARQLTDIE